jgi:hypothetical protein
MTSNAYHLLELEIMIDTIKLGISLSESQFTSLKNLLDNTDRWQWAQINPLTEQKRFRYRGDVQLDRPSFHRNIIWTIPNDYELGKTFLNFEFSLPKYWYGHNIYLLHDFINALETFKVSIETQFDFELPELDTWQLFRVDCCYSWSLPNQQASQSMLDSLKCLRFPYKKPTIYTESLFFPGATYSVKFYLKYPEFIKHDRRTLLKQKVSLEWINHLESIATGVVRFEVTLKQKYLMRNGLETVADLKEQSPLPKLVDEFVALKLADNHEALNNLAVLAQSLNEEESEVTYNEIMFTSSRPASILESMLAKFLGENRQMEEHQEIKYKLLQKYKPNKAVKLTALWLYVQQFGYDDAKSFLGKDAYYDAKGELEAAGCSFIERPPLSDADKEFLRNFRFEIGSPYVTNAVDMPRPKPEDLPPLVFIRDDNLLDDDD